MSAHRINVRVVSIRSETAHVAAIRLASVSGEPLPPFEPGAHIDLHLENGLTRSYSLLGDPGDRTEYSIGVLHDRNSRGGSRFIHETFASGHTLTVSAPRNDFPLEVKAAHSIFIAGGIGITPMLPMVARMQQLGSKVELLYACRSRSDAAFVNEVESMLPAVEFHFDDEAHGTVDLRQFMSSKPATAHFYCCGPTPMLNAFEAGGREIGLPNLHLERFSAAAPTVSSLPKAFEVELQSTGKCYVVEEGKTILETLLDEGLDLAYSCQAGICGSCETGVVRGTPEHLDSVLGEAEKARNDRMMICVSRSLCSRLVLDL
jgi:ferredoxin-NADP reductase